MRSMLLAGFVALSAVAAIAPAHAQSHRRHRHHPWRRQRQRRSRRASAQADQSATTLGGVAGRHGVAITNGGNNRNIASGASASPDKTPPRSAARRWDAAG